MTLIDALFQNGLIMDTDTLPRNGLMMDRDTDEQLVTLLDMMHFIIEDELNFRLAIIRHKLE